MENVKINLPKLNIPPLGQIVTRFNERVGILAALAVEFARQAAYIFFAVNVDTAPKEPPLPAPPPIPE